MRAVVVAIGFAFAGHLALSAALPPLDDELYYWCWAKDPQWSYYDHPPMTAAFIRLGTALFGDTLFGIRFPACVATAISLLAVMRLTKPRGIALTMLLTPVFTLGGVLVTPDTPLLVFWSLYLAWMAEIYRRLDLFEPMPKWLWIAGGTLLGCGILGKYTMALAIPAGLAGFLMLGRMHIQRWLPGYILHLAAGFATACPILIHNVQHDFTPLLYQWRHTMHDAEPGLRSCGEFLGVQILLFGTLPVILLPWVWKHRRELLDDATMRACACLYALPLVFFLWKSTRGPIEGNWALAAFLGFWPVMGRWWQMEAWKPGRKLFAALTFGLPMAAVAILVTHLIHPWPWLPPEKDRMTRLTARHEFAASIAADLRERAAGRPVFAVDYQWVSFLRFHGLDARQIDGATRPSHFTQRPERPADCAECLVFCDYELRSELLAGTVQGPALAQYEFRMRGITLGVYQLWECRRDAGATISP